jgi:aspartate racemase
MHKVAPQIETGLTIPFIHLADATAEKIKSQGLNEVGLLATVYTMEEDFYTGRLTDKNIKVIVPEKPVRESVNRVIFNELCLGKKEKSSKELFIQAAKEMFDKGAQGLILGCTEISMLIDQQDFKEPVFDTTKIHIEKALGLALD